MKNKLFLTIVFLLAVIQAQKTFAQTVPARMDIPGWVRMGMTLAQARGNVPGNRLTPRDDAQNQYIYTQDYRPNDSDLYILTITPEKGLCVFQMGITFDVRNAVQIITQRYGEPSIENDETIRWFFEGDSRNIQAIIINIHNRNYNYLNLRYFFSNFFE